jgi:2-polyprenyl-3-methyl-5-hydroxy-6-metoxy-1,4-benzoquinol methylase
VSWDYYGDPRPDIQAVVSAAGRRILDVGCAGGTLAAALKASGAAFVAGVERHPEAAAHARPLLDALVEGDLLTAALPFALASFDYVLFADVLEHLPEPETALRRYLPLLAPEGRVVVSVPNMRFYLVLLRLLFDRWEYADSGIRDRTHLRIFTRRSLLALIEGAGLRLERLERSYRLLEDQSQIGRVGALATRLVRATLAPLLFRDLMAFQYVAVARKAGRP